MVSTIANGGMYLPPHILMPGQLTAKPGQDPPLHAKPFRPHEDLPNPLPKGAHRVISTTASAEMRQMMEGVVLYGTGKTAQLDGYSSAGKTGTAQKIDPRTHRYSKTMHIASFAGFAPVNNPVISVAVIIDSPKGAYYGTAVAAPVFAEVAQQVLEYLGVPHDIPLRPPSETSKPQPIVPEDTSADNSADIQALYDAANQLPPDDPLSTDSKSAKSQPATHPQEHPAESAKPESKPQPHSEAHPPQPAAKPSGATSGKSTSVTISNVKPIAVPSLTGLSVRQVIEKAASAGLEVEILGDGTVRQQAPAPGTMVPPGTHVVVRCTR